MKAMTASTARSSFGDELLLLGEAAHGWRHHLPLDGDVSCGLRGHLGGHQVAQLLGGVDGDHRRGDEQHTVGGRAGAANGRRGGGGGGRHHVGVLAGGGAVLPQG